MITFLADQGFINTLHSPLSTLWLCKLTLDLLIVLITLLTRSFLTAISPISEQEMSLQTQVNTPSLPLPRLVEID